MKSLDRLFDDGSSFEYIIEVIPNSANPGSGVADGYEFLKNWGIDYMASS